MKRRITALLAGVALLAGMLGVSGCGETAPSTLLAADGTVIATYDGTLHVTEPVYTAFAQFALDEAASHLAKKVEKAYARLAAKGYQIETTLDTALLLKVQQAVTATLTEAVPGACAITNLQGAVVALYGGTETDYANTPVAPGSTMKPLSVYAPAIDSGVANWASVQLDTPVKKVMTGITPEDWPKNATGTYSGTNETVATAIKHSLNTVAVKWLQTVGVTQSMDFLETNFALDLSQERQLVKDYSEDEVLANIALGYLRSGVTVTQMAGCYQIFATGGTYVAPYGVTRLSLPDGKAVYDVADTPPASHRVISEDTAAIMLRLLRTVTQPGGTGEAASRCRVSVAGKTGTTDYGDNWFAGVSPEYACALWHGTAEKNNAAAAFAAVIEAIAVDATKAFPANSNIKQGFYCEDSGMLLGDNCTKMEGGWFAPTFIPGVCNLH